MDDSTLCTLLLEFREPPVGNDHRLSLPFVDQVTDDGILRLLVLDFTVMFMVRWPLNAEAEMKVPGPQLMWLQMAATTSNGVVPSATRGKLRIPITTLLCHSGLVVSSCAHSNDAFEECHSLHAKLPFALRSARVVIPMSPDDHEGLVFCPPGRRVEF